MKTRFQVKHKVQLAFAAAIAILLIVGAFTYRSMVVSSESNEWVRHTYQVQENLQDVLFAMESAESNARALH